MEPQRNHLGQPVGLAVAGWSPRPLPPRTAMAGRFCTVEPLDPERHAAELFEANAEDREGRNWTYYPYGPFATLAEYRAWIAGACADSHRLFHAIRDNAAGTAVGVAAYINAQPAVGVVEVGSLVFSPRLLRRPAASEAMYLMMRRVFDEAGYRRYEWKCDLLNAPSRAAALRLGFRYEGLFRQATITRGRAATPRGLRSSTANGRRCARLSSAGSIRRISLPTEPSAAPWRACGQIGMSARRAPSLALLAAVTALAFCALHIVVPALPLLALVFDGRPARVQVRAHALPRRDRRRAGRSIGRCRTGSDGARC